MKETNKWSVRDVITTVLLSAVLIVIQLVVNMVCMANDFVSMVLSVGITMFLCAPVYMLMVSRIGKRDASDEEVLAAAKAAQCDAFVSRLPDGYHTLIGENGSRLSGGERQRISIARAILKDAPVILLDEATASLDVENETAVQAALSGLIRDKTVLIIAHRMRTVMNADQIVLLSGGRVVEMGSPAELLKKNGLFRHMAQLQNESMEWTA